MKRVGILLAAAVLATGGSALRAGEAGGVPGTLELAPVAAPPASPCCAAPDCGGHAEGHSGRFCDWLLYKPPATHCACHCAISTCVPPLYLWFLDTCQGGACGHGRCGGHRGHCAGSCRGPVKSAGAPCGCGDCAGGSCGACAAPVAPQH